jgi:O-antigen ligase
VLIGGLIVSFSRGAWLGAAAAGVALMAALPRRWGWGLALVAGGGALVVGLLQAGLMPASIANRLADVADFANVTDVRGVNINDDNFAIVERLAHWQAAEGMARDNPWLGVGLGNYGAAYPRYALLNWPNALGHAHMVYLNVLAETGVVNIVALSGTMAVGAADGARHRPGRRGRAGWRWVCSARGCISARTRSWTICTSTTYTLRWRCCLACWSCWTVGPDCCP